MTIPCFKGCKVCKMHLLINVGINISHFDHATINVIFVAFTVKLLKSISYEIFQPSILKSLIINSQKIIKIEYETISVIVLRTVSSSLCCCCIWKLSFAIFRIIVNWKGANWISPNSICLLCSASLFCAFQLQIG